MRDLRKRISRGVARRSRSAAVRIREATGPRAPDVDTSTPEVRLLFVCLGNICRSPLAEGIMRAKLAEAGLLGRVAVDSAGTSDWNVGRPPDDRARLVAQRHGVSIGDLRARQIREGDFQVFDRIVVFDADNLAAMRELAPDEESRRRIVLLRGENGEIADPIAGSVADFEEAFDVIDEGCSRLLADLRASVA